MCSGAIVQRNRHGVKSKKGKSKMFKTEIRDKRLYITNMQEDYNEPRLIINFWLTNTPPYPEFNNLRVYEIGSNGKYINALDKQIPVNPISEYPEFTEFIPLKPPSKRYKWHNGEWHKL